VLGALVCASTVAAELPGTHTVEFIDADVSDLLWLEADAPITPSKFTQYGQMLDAVEKTWGLVKNIFSSSETTTLIESRTKLSFNEVSS
jgi:hypothetical protein